jgi:hypothetical protein
LQQLDNNHVSGDSLGNEGDAALLIPTDAVAASR